MKKRIISILLSVGLIVGTWDMAALAKETQPLQETTTEGKEVDAGNEAEKALTAQAAYAQFNTANMYAIANYGIKQKTGSYMLLKVPSNKNGRVMPMIISPADHSTGELYTLAKVGNWYTVTPKCAGSWRLNVEGEQSKTDTDVGLWTNTNHSTQGWYFEPAAGVVDGYIIRSANDPTCVLDVRGTTTGKGVKVKKYEPDNPCQIWIVRAYAASITLNKTSATLDIGKTVTLSANKKPVDMPVTYTSSAAKVATVNSKGVVTAKAAGTATITAKCCGKTATCKITVRKSTLAVSSKISKTKKKKKKKNGVSGTVSSNKKITKITAQIIGKSNKKTYYSKTVKPNKTSYKLTGTVDKAMKFDKLGKGAYIFRVTAWDAAGSKVSKDIGCTVNEKAIAVKKTKLEQQIVNTDKKAKKIANQNSFNGYCGAYVYYELRARGIYTGKNSAYEKGVNGNQWYKLLSNKKYTKSTGKYKVRKYGGKKSLDKLSNSGKNTVYNVVVSYKNGSGSGRPYGHVVFIHAIKGGKVYFSESYDMFGVKEGDAIVVSYSKFKKTYNNLYTEPLGAVVFQK